MNSIRKTGLEYTFIFVIAIISIIACFIEFININIVPVQLVKDYTEIKPVILVLIQVQASISAIIIALVSIISGLMNDNVYGIVISKYILQLKPRYLKHKTIIIVELLFLILSYILYVSDYYNLCIAVFIISIVLLLFMVNEIFIVFNGKTYLKDEIKDFILNSAMRIKKFERYDILENLDICLMDLLNTKDTVAIIENYTIMNELIVIQSIMFTENDELKSKWEVLYAKIIRALLNKKNVILQYSIVYDLIHSTLVKQSESKELKGFIFWDHIHNDFYRSLSNYRLVSHADYDILSSIRNRLYTLSAYKTEDGSTFRSNNSYLEYFTSSIYINAIGNVHQEEQKNDIIQRIKVDMYKSVKLLINYGRFDSNGDLRIKDLYRELLNYVRVLIDYNESSVISKTVFDISVFYDFKRDMSLQIKEFYYVVLIYIYYLSEKEKIISDEFKNNSKQILEANADTIRDIMYVIDDFAKFDEENIVYVKEILSRWEILPENEAKYVIMDNVSRNFMLFNIIANDKHIESIAEKITPIIGDESFSVYNDFFGNNRDNQFGEYIQFLKLFYSGEFENSNIDEDDSMINKEVVSDFERLESILTRIYKMHEIDKSYRAEIDKTKLNDIEIQLVELGTDKLVNHCNKFREILLKEKCKKITFDFSYFTYTQFLSKKDLDTYIEEMDVRFITYIIRNIYDKLDMKKINFRRSDVVYEFLSLAEMSNIPADLLIGYRNWFHRPEAESDFRAYESGMKQVHSSRLSNIIIAVDSSIVGIEIKKIDIKLNDVDFESIINDLDIDDDGKYLYRVTNDIYLPFERKELKEFIKRTRKKIDFKVELIVTDSTEILGFGVVEENLR